MKYLKKQVKLPKGFVVGSKILIVGEGDEIFSVTEIEKDDEGNVTGVLHSGGFSEAMCKMCLANPINNISKAYSNNQNYIEVAIGECDSCGKKFPDSCMYHRYPSEQSMMCPECYQKTPEYIKRTRMTMSKEGIAKLDELRQEFGMPEILKTILENNGGLQNEALRQIVENIVQYDLVGSAFKLEKLGQKLSRYLLFNRIRVSNDENKSEWNHFEDYITNVM